MAADRRPDGKGIDGRTTAVAGRNAPRGSPNKPAPGSNDGRELVSSGRMAENLAELLIVTTGDPRWKGPNTPTRQMRKWRLERSEETSPSMDESPRVEHSLPACCAAKIDDDT